MKNKTVRKKTIKKKKRVIRFDRILIFFLILFIIISCVIFLFNLKITNIYVINNSYLSDQEIIEFADIDDYPSTIKNLTFQIQSRLEKHALIKSAKVRKKSFTKVYIEVEENRPLFYYNATNEFVLLNGTSIKDKFSVPTVVNYITDNYYKSFITEMGKLNIDILNKISEITFSPNDVDDNRFLLSMNDGNYVYVNISTFNKLNKYLEIMENLPKEKGILYLDYGNNFEIIK